MESVPVYPLDRPRVRAVDITPAEVEGRSLLVVRDPLGLIEGTPLLKAHPLLLLFLQMADGRTTVGEMSARVSLMTGEPFPSSFFESLAQQLDEALLLQSERFRDEWQRKVGAFRSRPTRPGRIYPTGEEVGPEKANTLREELDGYAAAAGGPPEALDLPPKSVVGVLAPHIDYSRGGPAYAWAYKALREHAPRARTWIVLGTCHHPTSHRFIATRKDFETPWGVVRTDREVLGRLEALFGGELYRDEYSHAGEHTIELQAVHLKHTFPGEQTPAIVPILVGSFHSLLEGSRSPGDVPEIAEFCGALRTLLKEEKGGVGILGSVDLSHCGPHFGDELPNDERRVNEICAADREMLRALESGDPDRFFDTFRPDHNARNVCSIAAIYCVMKALRGIARPRVLTHQHHNSQDRSCLVSFTSVAFVRDAPGSADWFAAP